MSHQYLVCHLQDMQSMHRKPYGLAPDSHPGSLAQVLSA